MRIDLCTICEYATWECDEDGWYIDGCEKKKIEVNNTKKTVITECEEFLEVM